MAQHRNLGGIAKIMGEEQHRLTPFGQMGIQQFHRKSRHQRIKRLVRALQRMGHVVPLAAQGVQQQMAQRGLAIG